MPVVHPPISDLLNAGWDVELSSAMAAALAGAEVAAASFQSFGDVAVRQKQAAEKSYDLVTDADIESERRIIAAIGERHPQHAILGEESHEQGDVEATQNGIVSLDRAPHCPHLWVVDPIDGTNNFAHGVPHFGVSIAYWRNGAPHTGVVVNPATNDWFLAQAGRGAWRSTNQQTWTACQTASETSLDQSLIGVGFYYDRGPMMRATLDTLEQFFGQNIHGIRRFGTASLDLCFVGCGQLGGFFEFELSPWDFAAGALFVQEAGGNVTSCQGAPLPLARSSLLATNGCLHDAMLAIVKPRGY